ncbi:MAG: hypothetical protein JW774_00290 [Candidatus Aureabacteria bacterium]|nr:hypothetical protein [Candidatus Auribacterota bacterium]
MSIIDALEKEGDIKKIKNRERMKRGKGSFTTKNTTRSLLGRKRDQLACLKGKDRMPAVQQHGGDLLAGAPQITTHAEEKGGFPFKIPKSGAYLFTLPDNAFSTGIKTALPFFMTAVGSPNLRFSSTTLATAVRRAFKTFFPSGDGCIRFMIPSSPVF